MIVFAADTATEYCNMAIMKDEKLLAELSFKNRGTHSKNIVQNIDYCYRLAGISPGDTDLFAAGTGPGNFTGVRIGVSTLKGLSYVLKKPLVGVSALESTAGLFRYSNKTVLCAIDARRKEVYYSFYRFEDSKLVYKSGEKVAKPEDIKNEADSDELIITGNASFMYKDIFDAKFERAVYPEPWMNEIKPQIMCEIAVEKYRNDPTDETFGIVPNYIRRSNAEENLKKP